MPEGNAEHPDIGIVRHGFELWNRGDVEGVFEFYDPDVRWRVHEPFLEEGIYEGHEQLAKLLATITEGMEIRLEVEEIYESKGRIVVLSRQRGRFKGGELDVYMPIAYVFRMRDGMAIEVDVGGRDVVARVLEQSPAE